MAPRRQAMLAGRSQRSFSPGSRMSSSVPAAPTGRHRIATGYGPPGLCLADRRLALTHGQPRMLIARENTSATVSREANDCTIINNLAQVVSGIVSVGLKAVALVKEV